MNTINENVQTTNVVADANKVAKKDKGMFSSKLLAEHTHLTRSQMCQYLGISSGTLWRWMQFGKGVKVAPWYKLNNRFVWYVPAIKKWEEKRAKEASAFN